MSARLLLATTLSLAIAASDAAAQVVDSSAQWTWMGGDNTNLDRGLVGQMGVPSTTNRISSRWQSHSWTGNDGKLYVFGGEYNNGNNGAASGNTLNDLWVYDITAGTWTLLGGIFSNNTNAGFNVPGIYGTLKTAAPGNWPGSRRGGTTWKDAAGNFWLFGGWGGTTPIVRGYFNDLWKYNPTSGQWTWVSGTNGFATTGTYGTQGTPSTTNIPSGRGGYAWHGGNPMGWMDAAGNMWIYGGYGYGANGAVGALNDLWKYDPVADTWTWVHGSDQINQPPVYGQQGVAAAGNTPGARYSSFNWTDQSGRFWLYGGVNYNGSTYTYYADLWMFNPATNMWTWMGGSNLSAQPTVYGTKGVAAAGNTPGSRFSAGQGSAWVDVLGKFWLYGGRGYVNTLNTYMSDLWQYDPATNMWTWMKGPDPATAPHLANRGTLGVRDPANYPPGKTSHLTWVDLDGNFWLLGGLTHSNGVYTERPTGDLWRLDQVVLIPRAPLYTDARPHICIGDTAITYTYEVSTSAGASHYIWNYTGTGVTLDDTTTVPRNQLTFNPGATSGRLEVIAWNQHGASPVTDTLITVQAIPKVDLGPDIDTCGMAGYPLQSRFTYPGGTSYAWSTGATSASISATTTNQYWLRVTENGCSASDTIDVKLLQLSVDLGPDISICDRDLPVVLTSQQPAGVHYLWSTGLSDTMTTATRTGRYWLEVSYKGCKASDSIFVDVVPTPVITLGADSTICAQFPATIGYELSTASYLWNTGATTPFINVSQTGEYILNLSLRGCTVSDTIQITALPVPPVNLGSDRDLCEESTMILDGTLADGVDYLWNTGATEPSIAVSEAGVYWVRVVTEHQCVGVDTVTLRHYPKPYISLGADTSVCRENPLQLRPYRLNTDYINWSDGSRGDVLSVIAGGTYIAEAVNKCGTDQDTVNVREIFCDIFVPSAFSPNNDGKNDIFRISGNTGRIRGFSMNIYNRWGELIFQSADKTQGWDGRKGTTDAPIGTYAYVIEYNIDGKPYKEKGTVDLVR